ncbi:hypothetical protein [Streptomyces sp. NPDC055287]
MKGCLGQAVKDFRKDCDYLEVGAAATRISAARSVRGEEFGKGPVTDEEAIARADVARKNDTGLPETWLAVESRPQETTIAKDAVVLRRLRGPHEKRVAAARAIVAEG